MTSENQDSNNESSLQNEIGDREEYNLSLKALEEDLKEFELTIEEKWTDNVLDVFKKASNGQLITSKSFMFESATHSLEIMNPKLDSGAVGGILETPEQLYDKGEITNDKDLSIREVIAIMDRLMGLEGTWIEGSPIAHTLFSCMYMHVPMKLENKYLALYINTLLATCDTVFQIVSRGDICLEEDFNLSTFGLEFLNPRNQHTVVVMRELSQLETTLKEDIKQLENSPTKDQNEIDLLNALLYRIIFRRMFFVIIISVASSNISMASKVINEIPTVLSAIKKSSTIVKDVEMPKGVFNLMLANKLISCMGSPPEFKALTINQSISFYEKLFSDFLAVFKMPHLSETYMPNNNNNNNNNNSNNNHHHNSNNNSNFIKLSDILDYHLYLSRLSPNIVVRSVLRRLLFPLPNGAFFRLDSIPTAVIEWMNEFGVPYQYLKLPNVTVLIDRFAHAYQKILIHTALNRARQRRKLKNSLLDLSILQNEADTIDTEIAKDKLNVKILFGSFIFNLKLKIMAHFLYLGIQYQVQSYIYKQSHPENKKEIKKKLKKSQNKPLQQQSPPPPQQIPPTPERLITSANHMMAKAMFRLFTMLKVLGKIKEPECQYSTPLLRFLKKFEFFNNPPFQQPEPLTLEQCQQASNVKDISWFGIALSTIDVLNQVKMAIDAIIHPEKKIVQAPWYTIEEAKELLRVYLSTSLQLKKILPKNFETMNDKSDVPFPENISITIDPKINYPIISFKSD
eukprot:gene5706-7100_t